MACCKTHESRRRPSGFRSNDNTHLHHIFHAMHTLSPDGSGWKKWFQKFLGLGVLINTKNNIGETALFKYFSKAPNWKNKERQIEHYTLFNNAGADIFTKSNDGETLLHTLARRVPPFIACRPHELAPALQFLMNKGLDPLAEDKGHRTPLVSDSSKQ